MSRSSCKYAVVCSDRTARLWPNALGEMKKKYETIWPGRVEVIPYCSPPNESKKQSENSKGSRHEEIGVSLTKTQLSALKPYFTCFLAHHEECDKDFVWSINKLTRALDGTHPFCDTLWGILTGFCEDDVLASLNCEPLTISRVVANCPIDLEKFSTGVWFSEFEQGICHRKVSSQGKIVKEVCPDDATETIVQEFSTDRVLGDGPSADDGVDMIISSGHASESNWHITYTFEGGKFCSSSGVLRGVTVGGESFAVTATKSPKVLCASGNCLMAHVKNEHCMALGWMHSGSVRQMVGYIEPTWYGYGGWGVNKYFINNPGSKTFAESFFANQQTLLYQLRDRYKEYLETVYDDHCEVYDKCFNTTMCGIAEAPRECSGLVYDRDNVVFYGDPAWKAKLECNPEVDNYRLVANKHCIVSFYYD